MSERQQGLRIRRERCPYCKADVVPEQAKMACDACMAWHHTECWTAHGSCSACGVAVTTGSQAEAPRRVVRPCVRPGCTAPATEYLDGHEWCEAHVRETLLARNGMGARTVAIVFALAASAALFALPAKDHVNLVVAAGGLVLAAFWFLADLLRRRAALQRLTDLRTGRSQHKPKT